MAQSQATSGFGTLLQVGDGASPEVFTTIAECTNIKPPQQQTGNIDVTHHESPNSHRELIASLRSSGTVQFTINYLPANATHANTGQGLLKLQQDRTVKNWKIVLTDPAATEWLFSGFVSNFDPQDIGVDDKISATCEITIGQAVTLP